MKKSITIPLVALTIVGAGLYYGSSVSATDTSFVPPVAKRLATKFNLSEADVATVFSEERAEHQAERQQEFITKLEAAVAAGKLTSQQKDALLAKHAEMQKEHETFMQQRMQKHAELLKWAEDNKIDPSFLPGQMRGGAPHMQRMNGGVR